MTLVRCESLEKDYFREASLRDLMRGRWRGRRATVLKGVSFLAQAGECVAVLGENGAGKSTLLKCLAGLLIPTRGRAEVCGHDCAQGGALLRRDAVYVSADARSFAWRLSGRANLEFFAALHGMGRAPARARADALLENVGLRDAGGRRVAEYSAGMRQRLAIARAFLGEPRVLLLDEPTAGLDPRAAKEQRAFVRSLAEEGRCVLIATNQPDEARTVGSRAIVLDKGQVVYSGSVGTALETIGG